ncbi:MAG: AAA family ATPase [Lachnospiraceae bacterium]|nr:AAA family ATPase [Lachnospiraceae bacterium]
MKENMNLMQASIEGYRNIERDTLVFGDITTLVSTNSYGKSNLMNAIDFAVDFIHADRKSRQKMMAYFPYVPLNKYMAGKNFKADFVFSTKRDESVYFVNYGFSFEWISDVGGRKITDEWLTVKEDKKSQKANTLIRRSEKPLYKASPEGRCSSIMKVADDELIINKLQMLDNLYYHDLVEMINGISVYVERHFDTVSMFSQGTGTEFEDPFNLSHIDNIPRIIYKLKQQYPDKYDTLMDAFLQLFPNIQELDVREIDLGKQHHMGVSEKIPFTISDKVYSMYVKDRNLNQPINISSLSDGARRVFLMLTYTIIADIEGLSLIAMEEPENSIHPGLLQSYLNVLSQLAGNCRILIASHSPYIIQYVNTADIYIGKPNDKGMAEFARINPAKVNILLKDSMKNSNSVGDYIFDLLSGGEDDTAVLLDYLED